MTRDREHRETLGPFPDWHRDNLPSWYTCIDIDYAGYIDPSHWPEYGYEPYVFIELIHIANPDAWGEDVPSKYPIHDHKEAVYEAVREKSGVPVYILWHPTDCREFFIHQLGTHEKFVKRFTDKRQLMDLLDHLRKQRIKELNP